MKAVIQRVKQSSVTVEGRVISSIGAGLLVLLGVAREDRAADAAYLAEKCANLRIFEDETGKMNRSLLDTEADM
ncbi:MAG TPA: D-aminoacyl-tRNA deacylase, partial [Desulfosalsimonadaceae bacterium]|nr:D-aminoacyl-tRNA deacylase [Desulfosalsimonadaceae bacterium]